MFNDDVFYNSTIDMYTDLCCNLRMTHADKKFFYASHNLALEIKGIYALKLIQTLFH